MEQIVELLGRMSWQVLLVFFALLGVGVIAILSSVSTQLSGLERKGEVLTNAINEALNAWAIFATEEEFQNAYPIRVEIEVEKLPFGGLYVKKHVVVVRDGFREKRYQWVPGTTQNIYFKEENET